MAQLQVTKEQYHAHLALYPNRTTYRTGIVEPPQEISELPDGFIIGHIRLLDSYGQPNEYFITEQ